MYKIRFRLRSLQRSPLPLGAFKGPISKGKGRGGEGKRRRKGGSKKEFSPQSSPQIDATGLASQLLKK